MPKISTSPINYIRLTNIRQRRSLPFDDVSLTGNPRYGKNTVRTHRLGELRLGKWIKYA